MLDKVIPIFLLAVILHYILIHRPVTPKDLTLTLDKTQQLNTTGPILNENGTLAEVGWSFRHSKQMNIENAAGPLLGIKALNWLRWKKYDYYAIIGAEEAIQVYIFDAGFQACVFFKHFDFAQKQGRKTATAGLTFGSGAIDFSFPDTHTVNEGYTATLKNDGHEFISLDKGGKRDITFSSPLADYQLQFDLTDMDRDVSYDVIPLSSENKTWFYTEKIYNLPFSAKVKFSGDASFRDVDTENMSAVIDIGRGFFNYHNDFLWFSGGMVNEGNRYAWTLQQGFSQSSSRKSQPDYFFFNNVGTQLHPVSFKVDTLNWNNPIKVFTADDELRESKAPGTLELVMQTMGSMRENSDLKVVQTDITHVYGFVSGWIVDKDGVEHKIEGGNNIFESFYAKF